MSPLLSDTPPPDGGTAGRSPLPAGAFRPDRLPVLPGWAAQWWRPAVLFVASRLVILLAVWLATVRHSGLSWESALGEWDSRLWAGLAEHGYPSNPIPAVGSTLAFFPLYALVLRAVAVVTGLSALTAGVLVATVSGLVATVLLWFLTADVRDRRSADLAAALFCLSPGALAFSMAYSEGLLLALAVPAVWAAMRQRWVLAGVLAGLATAVRPNALGLIPLMVLMAAVAVRKRRDWRALTAPALAPVGGLAFLVYLRLHTGSWTAWQRAQSQGWSDKSNFRGVPIALRTLLAGGWNPTSAFVLLGAAMIVAGCVFMWRARTPWPLVTFAALALLPALASQQVSTKPRMVLVAFPLFVAAGAVVGRVRGRLGVVLAGGVVVLTAAVTVLVSAYILGVSLTAP